MFICDICGCRDVKHISRCDKHYYCDDCKTIENLCTYTEGVLCHKCHTIRVNKRLEDLKGAHSYTTDIICPYCGYALSDSWDYSDSGDIDCPDCMNNFNFESNVSISYSTSKIMV